MARCPPGDQWGVVFLSTVCWWHGQRDRGHPPQVCRWHRAVLCGQHSRGKGCHPEGPWLGLQSPWCCTNVQSLLTPLSLRQLSYLSWHGCLYFLSLVMYRQLHFWICFSLFFICAVCGASSTLFCRFLNNTQPRQLQLLHRGTYPWQDKWSMKMKGCIQIHSLKRKRNNNLIFILLPSALFLLIDLWETWFEWLAVAVFWSRHHS